jgi:hypothetical protein
MSGSSRHLVLTLPFLLVVTSSALAQQQPEEPESAGGARVAIATRVDEAPVIDGEVLDDPAWSTAVPLTGFWQTTPDEGRPASEETEVRIVYTSDTLYFGVICYDRQPHQIIVSDSRRDAPLDETDSFQIILDTYLDQQNGFVFGTNPAGIEYDGQVTNEVQGGSGSGRQQAGSGGGFNINWDGSWEVRTRVSAIGWSAEFAIPFRTLRYASRDVQAWGVNFQRNIRRRNETAFWSPLPRQFNLYRLSFAGRLTNLEIPGQRNLKLMPYLRGAGRRQPAALRSTRWDGDAGVDLKYSLTPSLTLDLTYNTDFAQVEVDEEQINLDRFTLFFPEKRPFFLENAGLFAVGTPGEVELFFSRRIGIAGGREVPIQGGARVSGRIGRTNVGLLNMQTGALPDVTPGNNFGVARVSRELPNRSNLGALFTSRQGAGHLSFDDDHHRLFAVDGRWGLGRRGSISGFAARSLTPGAGGREHAFSFGARYDIQSWLVSASYTEVGEAFDPQVGFLQRRGYRKPDLLTFHRFRPASLVGLHEIRPHVAYRGFWTFDGFQETGYLHVDTHWEWKNGYEVHTGVNFTREGVFQPFTLFGVLVPPGTYDHREAQIVAFTNRGAWLSFQLRSFLGGFFGGSRVSTSPSMRLRVGETFNTEFSWSRNDVSLPAGRFVADLGRARVSYSFTPRVFVQGLIQYNNRDDLWSTNLRFGWLQQANTGIFIVYNDAQEFGDRQSLLTGRSLIVKVSRMLDLLD